VWSDTSFAKASGSASRSQRSKRTSRSAGSVARRAHASSQSRRGLSERSRHASAVKRSISCGSVLSIVFERSSSVISAARSRSGARRGGAAPWRGPSSAASRSLSRTFRRPPPRSAPCSSSTPSLRASGARRDRSRGDFEELERQRLEGLARLGRCETERVDHHARVERTRRGLRFAEGRVEARREREQLLERERAPDRHELRHGARERRSAGGSGLLVERRVVVEGDDAPAREIEPEGHPVRAADLDRRQRCVPEAAEELRARRDTRERVREAPPGAASLRRARRRALPPRRWRRRGRAVRPPKRARMAASSFVILPVSLASRSSARKG
jgi:hypothetical protein